MQNATNLTNGSFARTSGFYSYNDDGGAYYKIRPVTTDDDIDNVIIIELNDNTLVAELIPPKEIRPEIFGAYGDGTHNDTNAFIKMINYVYKRHETLWLPNKIMICENTYNINKIVIPEGMQYINIDGNNKGEIKNGGFTINEGCGWKTTIKNITFSNCDIPLDFKYYNIEFGRIEIENCNFYSCTTVALNIKRRSHRVYVRNCLFYNCDKTAYFEDIDMCYFEGNEIETNVEWSNNHYEVEQKATYEGTIFVNGNIFVPAITQNATNCAWLRIGRNATIENNRFSGENEGIHPIYIDCDIFDNFNPIDSYMYPIVNFINNPIVAGTGSILINKACGQLNIHNNAFTKISPCIEVIDETIFNNLSFNKLYISINDNTGKIFNFRNYGWASTINQINKPIIPKCLQKFIKTRTLFAKNYNGNYQAEISTNKLTINYNINDLTNTAPLQFLITGNCNPNPNGSPAYFENFVAIATLKREYLYDGTGINLIPEVKLLTQNDPYNVTLTASINGQSKIPTSNTILTDDIQLEITYSGGDSSASCKFKQFMPLELIPVIDNDSYYGEDYQTNN